MNSSPDQTWAFVHNELPAQEKERFNKELQENPELQSAFEEYKATHTLLKETLASSSEKFLSEEELTEKLIAEWASEHPDQMDAPRQKPRRKVLYFSAPLAAAAALVIFLSLPSGPIRWQNTAFGNAPQLRGETGKGSFYTRPQLNQAVTELQTTVEASCDPSTEWTLRVYLQELTNGALAIEISGHSNTPAKTSKVWEKTFQSLEDFQKKVPTLGKQIAGEL